MPEKVNGTNFSGKSNIESLNSNHSPVDSKSAVQLNSTEQKLATVQKMADNSPYSQRFAHFTSMANNSIPKQPVSQLSKDSHSLPDNVKQGVESLSGISMDDVKVHYNSAKPAQLNAHAYAQGTDIHIASGQEKHLPHEAWHVVQQKQGRVRPTTMMKAKVPINDDAGLEKEADVMGARALQMKPFSLSDFKTGKSVHKEGLVQRKPYYKDENNLLQAKLVKVDVGSAPIQMKLMTEDEFIKASGSMFSGTRDRVLEVDAALKKCISASSKSVGFTELIGACDKYLNIPEKKDKTRIAGVTKLKKNAVEELAAWRLRDRMPLPASVFRMDERGPGDIAKLGFQPWNGKGNISIVEHVKQVLKTKQETAPTGESGEIGMGAKKHSQFVSTAGDMNFAKDPTLLAGLLAKKFYKIDTTVDPLTFTDVNKHFDELGEPNPYEPQFEFIKSGGIPGNQVTHYVEGKALIDFVIAQTDASTWDIKWLPMPQSNA